MNLKNLCVKTRSKEYALLDLKELVDLWWDDKSEARRKYDWTIELLKKHPKMNYIEIRREAEKRGIIKADYLK